MTKYAFLERSVDEELGLSKEAAVSPDAYGSVMTADTRGPIRRGWDSTKDYFRLVGDNFRRNITGPLAVRMGRKTPEQQEADELEYAGKYGDYWYNKPTDDERLLYTTGGRRSLIPGYDMAPVSYSDDFGRELRLDENGNPVPRYFVKGTATPADSLAIHNGRQVDANLNEVEENPAWASAKPVQAYVQGMSQAQYDALMRRAMREQAYAESRSDNPFASSVVGKLIGSKHTPFDPVTYRRDENGKVVPFVRRSGHNVLEPAIDVEGNPILGDDGKPVYVNRTELDSPHSYYTSALWADTIGNPTARRLAVLGTEGLGLTAQALARLNPVTGPWVNGASAAGNAAVGNYGSAALDAATAGASAVMRPAAGAGKTLLGDFAGATKGNLAGIARPAVGEGFAISHPALATAGNAVVGAAKLPLAVGRQAGLVPYDAILRHYGRFAGIPMVTMLGSETLGRLGHQNSEEFDIPSQAAYDQFDSFEKVPAGMFGRPIEGQPWKPKAQEK